MAGLEQLSWFHFVGMIVCVMFLGSKFECLCGNSTLAKSLSLN